MNYLFSYSFTTLLQWPRKDQALSLRPSRSRPERLDPAAKNFKPPKGPSGPRGWLCLSLPKQRWSDYRCHWAHSFPAIPAIPFSRDWLHG